MRGIWAGCQGGCFGDAKDVGLKADNLKGVRSMKSNAQIFREAADYIREHGWIQGMLGIGGGPRCAVGAIVAVTGATTRPNGFGGDWIGDDGFVTKTLCTVAARRVGYSEPGDLAAWNDGGQRTQEEVIALFDDLAFDEELKAAARTCTPATPTPETGELVSEPQLQEA